MNDLPYQLGDLVEHRWMQHVGIVVDWYGMGRMTWPVIYWSWGEAWATNPKKLQKM
jgi:hypothetical protein